MKDILGKCVKGAFIVLICTFVYSIYIGIKSYIDTKDQNNFTSPIGPAHAVNLTHGALNNFTYEQSLIGKDANTKTTQGYAKTTYSSGEVLIESSSFSGRNKKINEIDISQDVRSTESNNKPITNENEELFETYNPSNVGINPIKTNIADPYRGHKNNKDAPTTPDTILEYKNNPNMINTTVTDKHASEPTYYENDVFKGKAKDMDVIIKTINTQSHILPTTLQNTQNTPKSTKKPQPKKTTILIPTNDSVNSKHNINDLKQIQENNHYILSDKLFYYCDLNILDDEKYPKLYIHITGNIYDKNHLAHYFKLLTVGKESIRIKEGTIQKRMNELKLKNTDKLNIFMNNFSLLIIKEDGSVNLISNRQRLKIPNLTRKLVYLRLKHSKNCLINIYDVYKIIYNFPQLISYKALDKRLYLCATHASDLFEKTFTVIDLIVLTQKIKMEEKIASKIK
ncbi:hypothetical protein COBT_001980 [Conglomerata obtusa]